MNTNRHKRETIIRDESGIAVLIVSLLLTALLGMLALAVDTGLQMQRQQALRYSLDSAVMRGLRQLRAGETDLTKVRSTIQNILVSSLRSYGLEPSNLRELSITFEDNNTRIQANGAIWSGYFFASALPSMGVGKMQVASSAAQFHREETTIEPQNASHIIAVVDTSCSMWQPHTEVSEFVRANGTRARGGKRIHAVISSLQKLILEGIDGKYLSVSTFDSVSVTRLPPMPINNEIEPGHSMTNRQRAMSITYELDRRHTRCSTRSSDGLLEGLVNVDRLLAMENAPAPEEVEFVFLTDGGATHEVTQAVPQLGWPTPLRAYRGLDAETFGRCTLGNSFVLGTTSSIKAAELVRRRGVRVTTLLLGAENPRLVGALELVSAVDGSRGVFPCRFNGSPFLIDRDLLQGPSGVLYKNVSDLDNILRTLSEGGLRVTNGPGRLVHPH